MGGICGKTIRCCNHEGLPLMGNYQKLHIKARSWLHQDNLYCLSFLVFWWINVRCRAVENAESARSVIYAIFSAHSAYFNVSRQKVPYFNVSRQNRVVFKTVLQQNNVEAC